MMLCERGECYDDIVVYGFIFRYIWKAYRIRIQGILEHHEGDAVYRIPACDIDDNAVWRVNIYCTSDTSNSRAGKSFQPCMST